MVSTMYCMDLSNAKMMFCWKAERSLSSARTLSVFCKDLSLLMKSEYKVLMCSCISTLTLFMYLLKPAAWLAMTVASLRDFSHFLMVSCGRGLETGEIPPSVLEILGKELLSGETLPDHLLTDF